MRYLLPFLFFLFFGLQGFTQQMISVSQPTTEYVIGIGNAESSLYLDILKTLQSKNKAMEIFATCESHQIIGIHVKNNYFKSYDEVVDMIMDHYPAAELHRKKKDVLYIECKDETLKQ